MWLVDDTDTVLDPTNANGALPPNINFFFGLLKADTLMARINEPPVGRDVNVYVRQRGSDLEIIAERDILTGGMYMIMFILKCIGICIHVVYATVFYASIVLLIYSLVFLMYLL